MARTRKLPALSPERVAYISHPAHQLATKLRTAADFWHFCFGQEWDGLAQQLPADKQKELQEIVECFGVFSDYADGLDVFAKQEVQE